jgi:diacylglycerol kinase (ATP)
MSSYSAITIIYNPKSTHSGKNKATELKIRLAELLPDEPITVMSTATHGHAELLAYEAAMQSPHPLIISASGDGGYHEVINGLMRAKHEGANPVAGLLPAGNANDHFNHQHSDDVAQEIYTGSERVIDLLKLTYYHNHRHHSSYVHSYIGLGITPQAGVELNSHRLNHFWEVWLVLKALVSPHQARLKIGDTIEKYDSVTFSNTSRMAKVMRMSDIAQNDDGKFEVKLFKRRFRLHVLWMMLVAGTRGLRIRDQYEQYEFTTVEPTPLQMDGEIIKLPANALVKISIEPSAIACIV